jgi:hypothetical protein
MWIARLSPCVLCAAIAAAALAGCAGSQVTASRPGLPPLRLVDQSGKLRGETFSSANAPNGCVTSGRRVVALSFHAKGQASGPFPGTFSLTGEATPTAGSPYFSETFTIKSGSKTISGSASTTSLKAMKITCNTRTHRSRSYSFTNVPANVENTLGPTSLTWAESKLKQTFR